MSVKSVPKKGYKSVPWLFQKEIEIPEEWEIKPIRELILSHKQGFYTNEKYSKNGIRLVRITDLQNPELDYNSMPFIELDKKLIDSFKVDVGDFLFARSGAIGRFGIAKQNIPCVFASYIIRFKLNEDLLLNNFLRFFLQVTHIVKQFNMIKQGSSNININAENIKSMKIILPPLPEQQQIASILSNVDNLIQNTDKLIEKTTRLKKGLMQELLVKGIGHTKFKEVTFGRYFISYEIPAEWELYIIKDLATVHGRIGWKNLRSDEYVESGFLMLSVWSLVDTSIYGINFKEGIKRLSKFRYDESPEIQLKDGDVLVAKDGDIGRIGFVKKLPEPATVNSHVVPVSVNNNLLNPEFLYWFFKSHPFQSYCKAFTSGTTVPLFTQKDLRNFMVPIPSLPEQQKIASILSNTDEKIQSYKRYKEKLQNLKTSLMQKLLTGEVRVAV